MNFDGRSGDNLPCARQNQANLERFRTWNFNFFFNHGDIKIIRKYKKKIKKIVRPSNFLQPW